MAKPTYEQLVAGLETALTLLRKQPIGPGRRAIDGPPTDYEQFNSLEKLLSSAK